MASIAQALPAPGHRSTWLSAWLREELAPYPGRTALVARMVTAATLVMIICMTFRLPFAPYGAVYALTLSRESLGATKTAAWSLAAGFILAGAYAIFGALLVLGDPMLHLGVRYCMWVKMPLRAEDYIVSSHK
jgi:multidrug resistance protein MdtO